jgi:hypothetical protein
MDYTLILREFLRCSMAESGKAAAPAGRRTLGGLAAMWQDD